MSFGVPTALIWLALALPVIALYFVRVKLRRVPVSTSLFWKQIYEEKPPRSFRQRFRYLLSLLLQLLLLLLLILAVADPVLPWQQNGRRRQVVVIDASAGMQADDLSPSRFAEAIREAQLLVDGQRAHDELAIVLAAARPQVVLGMSSHVPTMRRVLSRLRAQDAAADLPAAMRLAHQLFGNDPTGRIILLTDGCSPLNEDKDPDGQSPDDDTATPTVDVRLVGSPASNVGITRFQARRSLTDPSGYEILVQVSNLTPVDVECRLELDLNDLPVDILPLTLTAGETWSRSVEKSSLSGGTLHGRLTQIRSVSDDGETSQELNRLTVDDSAWAIVPSRDEQEVLLVTPGSLFLQKALEANPQVRLTVVSELPEEWPSGGLIVLHQIVPDRLPAGSVLVVDPRRSTDQWARQDTVAGPVVVEQNEASSLMNHVRLDNVLISSLNRIVPRGQSRLLAGSLAGDPVYLELLRDEGRCLLLNVSLDDGDLAFRTTFPVLISNALAWFSGISGKQRTSLRTGETAEVTFAWPDQRSGATEAASIRLVDPDGGTVDLAVSQRRRDDGVRDSAGATVGPLTRAGLYQVVANDQSPLITLAANLCDERESDLRPSEELTASAGTQTAAAGWLSRPLWFYLAVLACALTVSEWFLYHRRFTD